MYLAAYAAIFSDKMTMHRNQECITGELCRCVKLGTPIAAAALLLWYRQRTSKAHIGGPNWNELPAEAGIEDEILSYLDVKSLFVARQVCTDWKRRCSRIFDSKKNDGAGIFWYNEHLLKEAVNLFYRCTIDYNIELAEEVAARFGWFMNDWDVSLIANFDDMFRGFEDFNEDICKWNTQGARRMRRMFEDCKSFKQDISGWNVKGVFRMDAMFKGASLFCCDLSRWTPYNLTSLDEIFCDAISFSADLESWRDYNFTSMKDFSKNAPLFQAPKRWEIRSAYCTIMSRKGELSLAEERELYSTFKNGRRRYML